jgi:hypothetical protein
MLAIPGRDHPGPGGIKPGCRQHRSGAIEPLKIQEVDEPGKYAVEIRAKAMTVAGDGF